MFFLYIEAFVGSKKVLENFVTGSWKSPGFFPVKEWEPCIKHPVPDQVKPSFVIFDIRALWC